MMPRPAAFSLAIMFAALAAQASICSTPAPASLPRWTIDHYVYDPSLKQDWEVLIDCNHPAAPAQIELLPHRATPSLSIKPASSDKASPPLIHAGAAVEVSSPPNAPAGIHLSGTAMQAGFSGQSIRVRLNSSGRFVTALVRGPHSVELAVTVKTSWGRQ